MDTNKIEIIYQMLMKRIRLTDDNLNLHGITQDEILEMIDKKILEQQSDGTYKLYQVDKLRKYGITLLKKGKVQESDVCFKICYELAPTGKHICLQEMLASLKRHEYRNLFEIYQNLEKIHQEKNVQNNILYLYLLSIVTKVPEELQEKTRTINPSEIILPYSNGNKIENKIRIAISQNKFSYACELIKKRKEKEKEYSVKFELLEVLCNEAADWTRRFKYKIFQLIESESYEEIISMLIEQSKQRKLSELETNILLLTDILVKILKNGNIPTPTIEHTNNLQEAILGNNFHLALNINSEFLEFNQINKETNSIYILLKKINELISTLKINHLLTIESTNNSEQKEKTYTEIEELADFIRRQNMPIDVAIKNSGLFHEQALLVKLIYARDCYNAQDYNNGDKYLQDVENANNKTENVIILLEEIKTLRESYLSQNKIHTRKLSKSKQTM